MVTRQESGRAVAKLGQIHNTRHGHAVEGKTTPEYGAWANMLARCNRKTHRQYANYGGRGITVCERWQDFANFIADVGPRPSIKHTIERIDNNGNYEPSNVRWATRAEQLRNTRRTVIVEFRGDRMCLKDMAAKHGVSYDRLRGLMRCGRSFEDAMNRLVGEKA